MTTIETSAGPVQARRATYGETSVIEVHIPTDRHRQVLAGLAAWGRSRGYVVGSECATAADHDLLGVGLDPVPGHCEHTLWSGLTVDDDVPVLAT